ncbi:MAG: hypothetical protein P1V97_30735 [Planctomycetota bacterium]|nr:hypothetical protein [Planctomycetota bacterium]
MNTDEQKIEDELEDLVAKVKKQQEQLQQEVRAQAKVTANDSVKDEVDDLEDDLDGFPKVERIQEDLPVVKNRGQVIIDTLLGEKLSDKARVAIAFSLGLTCFYFYTIFMPLITIVMASYGGYRFFQWKKNREPQKPEGEEEIIDVDA